MAWGTIRKATEEDCRRVNEAAERFVQRHNITVYSGNALSAIEDLIHDSYGEAEWEAKSRKRLTRLWTACVRRALDSPSADGIAYGYVGYHAG